jgi:hypothetical protein
VQWVEVLLVGSAQSTTSANHQLANISLGSVFNYRARLTGDTTVQDVPGSVQVQGVDVRNEHVLSMEVTLPVRVKTIRVEALWEYVEECIRSSNLTIYYRS